MPCYVQGAAAQQLSGIQTLQQGQRLGATMPAFLLDHYKPMIRLAELKVPLSVLQYHPENHTEYHPEAALRAQAAQRLGIGSESIDQLTVHKRSFDARN